MKLRHGGLRHLEQQVLDGDTRALRALVRQAAGPNTLDVRAQMECRAVADGTGGARLQFTGYASTVDDPYLMQDWAGDYTEIVRSGAFTKTLSESPDVIFCLNHAWDGAPMARTGAGTLFLHEDSTGLGVAAALDGSRHDVYAVQSAMEAGELDAMSFAFWVVRQQWSPDYEQRDILEVDLDGGDTSVVTWPANPGTWGTTALRKQQALALARTRIPALLVARARDERRTGTLTEPTSSALTEVLELLSTAGVDDVAQPLLAELLDLTPDADAASTDAATPTPMSLSRMQLLEDRALHS